MIDNLENLNDIVIQDVNMEQTQYTLNVYFRHFTRDIIDRTQYNITDMAFPFNASDVVSIKDFLKDVQMFEF